VFHLKKMRSSNYILRCH